MRNTKQKSKVKIVFLDVDGVLNRGSFNESSSEFDIDCMLELRSLILNTQAKIVVSSTWKDSVRLMLRLKRKLDSYGIPIFDITEYRSHKPREVEISNWLSTHPEVENYVVLDDWDLSEFFPNNMVQTCEFMRIGLDYEWRLEAEKILNK